MADWYRPPTGTTYGTTVGYVGKYGYGTVFKMNSSGTITTLYGFCALSNCADGTSPYAGLIQGTDGRLYGTTSFGGAHNDGTVFSITTGGTLTTLHSFDGADGLLPEAGLIQDTNGTFYGTAYGGGASNLGTVFSLSVGLAPFVETRPTSGEEGAKVIILGSDLISASAVTFNGTAATFTVISGTAIETTVPAGATSGTVSVTTRARTLDSNVKFRVMP
ncbi:MAG: choice-of-anchor tandem repeat GloVer-containing protein [Candidatus Sulfotelmatobacter sp.]